METKTVKLGDIADYVQDRIDVSESNSSRYVGTENLKSNKQGVLFPATSYPKTGKIGRYEIGDILVSNIRPYFKKIWHATNQGTNSPDVLNFRVSSDRILQDFLALVLSNDRFFQFMMATSKGTKMPRGDKQAIKNYEFNLPSVEKQRQTVYILKAIDDKIELNQQINKNLLRLMDCIFNKLYLSSECVQTANKVMLSSLVRTKTKTFNPHKTDEVIVNHFSMPSFDDSRFPLVEAVANIKSNKNIVEPLSILVSKMNPEVKRVWIPNTSTDLLNVVSTEFLTFNADTPDMQAFIYAVVNSKNYQQFLVANATGSTNSRQRVLPKTAYSYEIPYDEGLAQKLGSELTGFIDLIKLNKEQNQHLTQLRNLLLPKLLAGEIDLSNIESVMNNG